MPDTEQPIIYVLGTAQDAGYPHIGCERECCYEAWRDSSKRRYATSLAVVDDESKSWWLIEATPDIREQLHLFRELTKAQFNYLPDGVIITHAHIGHYTGLMFLGKEAMNSKALPVFAMPRLKSFLERNAPWSQLVELNNIKVNELSLAAKHVFSGGMSVEAFEVPHRQEYSECIGIRFQLAEKSVMFIPDVDSWEECAFDIRRMVASVDLAFIDGTFYSTDELPAQRINSIPHPPVLHTMELFEAEPLETKRKIYFIHLNHTNPLLFEESVRHSVQQQGFNIAEQGKNH